MDFQINPELDLVLERTTDVKPEQVWKAWTEPELLKKWFCPRPWQAVECSIDLRPGGAFRTVMKGPNGETVSGPPGCYLEVVPNRKLAWTNALLPGYRPAPAPKGEGEFLFTAVVLMEPHQQGTKYTAIVIHENSKDRKAHEDMGFHAGWGAAFDQLVELVKSRKI
ncbi:MAG: SRPBCC family protein [Bdellovibrionota bacterium]